jgi:hypothetical protein
MVHSRLRAVVVSLRAFWMTFPFRVSRRLREAGEAQVLRRRSFASAFALCVWIAIIIDADGAARCTNVPNIYTYICWPNDSLVSRSEF